MQDTSLRYPFRLSFSPVFVAFLLCLAQPASAAPLGEYQGWLWETGVWGDSQLSEEYCFGNFVINFAGDLTWSTNNTGTIDVCYGRTTAVGGRAFDGVPVASAPVSESQSTRPLVSAGGNLYEIYGEDVGDGEGESRFGTLLSVSSDNLMMLGGYETFSEGGSFEDFRLIDLMVKSTSSVRNARTAADLAGTSWRVVSKLHGVDVSNVNVERAISTIESIDLLADNVCSYKVSDVLPDYSQNADVSVALQFDFGDSLDDRYIRGGTFGATNSSCTYTIDANKYLSISRTRTRDSDPTNPTVLTDRFVVSDNNQYLVNAPAPTVNESPGFLTIGYREASQMAAAAIDGTFLFNMAITEFGADGAGAVAAGAGGDRSWQEFDAMGRGKMVFNSLNPGTAPDGETGTWYSCDSEMTINIFEHEWTGTISGGTLALGTDGPQAVDLVFNDCDYRLDSVGRLSLYLKFIDGDDGGFEVIFRGYVNDSAEVLALTWNEVDEDPLNLDNPDEDRANIFMVLGMKYAGDLDADADADGLTNYEEFKSPLPPPMGAAGDANGDGNSDILWRNTSSGQNWLYLMNGPAIDTSSGINTVPTIWSIVGNGDYDGDGDADVLWRNSSTGQNWMYLMNGSTVATSAGVNTVASSAWQVAGNGDYNGDGKSDILWRNNATGQNWMYLMDGASIVSSVGVNTVPTVWQVAGNRDFDGDGKADILWRHGGSGQNWMYLMDGATIVSSVGVNTVPTVWGIAGTGDYNGDGNADILWRDSGTGQNWLYLMDGATIASSAGVNTVPTVWQVAGDGDYNGDGNADILWRHSGTGQNWMYLMNGAGIDSSVGVNTVNTPGWQIVNVD